MKFPSAFFAICGLLASASVAAAAPQEPVGSALIVVNLVTAEFNRDTRTLQQGDRVHQDETIEVGLDGSSELKLDDETKLALGPGSHLTLDKFVYDPAKAKGSIVLDLVKGTFRFMTGVAEKPTYVIKTPAAAITVRGTIFDVYVQEDGLSWLLLHEGAVEICNQRGKCRIHDEPGKLIRIGGDGDVGSPVKWASLQGKDSVPFDNAFPFVAKSPGIDPTPVFTRDAILLGTYPNADKPKRKTETTKPTKRAEKAKPTETKTKPKKTRTAKTRKSDDENIVTGMDIAVGIGGGLLNKRRGGGYDGPRGGGDMPNRGSSGRMPR
ncbi:FecR domain-containing protein [Hyphomicrobium sp. LHD-15]|uniref:FecR family protein n=1 Tax=Hyphomicrobium sp. LHD-15 TaxID=3072142 RepID=UPI00280FD3DE|nr:FecR domain-containing protein [Hyphomicrobium sp. LHD-15]MDQ8700245.1 FecR domain-containing protein [Hyphomicrobium sp. LHD-15]